MSYPPTPYPRTGTGIANECPDALFPETQVEELIAARHQVRDSAVA